MKEILYLAYSFPPLQEANAILNGKFTYSLAELGYRCHIVTITPETGTGSIDGSMLQLVHEHNAINRIPSRTNWRKSGPFLIYHLLRKIIPFMERIPDFYLLDRSRALSAAYRILRSNSIDLIFSTASPFSCHLAGLALKQKYNLPWIAHFYDLWLEQAPIRNKKLYRYVNGLMERQVIEHADAVTFISREALDAVMNKYPKSWKEKASVIPACFFPSLYPETPRGKNHSAKLIFRYLGSFYGVRTPFPLLKAISILKETNPDVVMQCEFQFIGTTRGKFDVLKRQLNLGGEVQFRESVGYLESLELMKSADVLVIIDAPEEGDLFLPSKLIDYIGAVRPILGVTPLDGPAARLIGRCGGIVVAPQDYAGIAQGVLDMMKGYLGRKYLPSEGFGQVYDQHSQKQGIAHLAALLENGFHGSSAID